MNRRSLLSVSLQDYGFDWNSLARGCGRGQSPGEGIAPCKGAPASLPLPSFVLCDSQHLHVHLKEWMHSSLCTEIHSRYLHNICTGLWCSALYDPCNGIPFVVLWARKETSEGERWFWSACEISGLLICRLEKCANNKCRYNCIVNVITNKAEW